MTMTMWYLLAVVLSKGRRSSVNFEDKLRFNGEQRSVGSRIWCLATTLVKDSLSIAGSKL